MYSFLLFIVMLFGLIFLSLSLTVFFLEMGHAVALLVVTQKPVKVYIGSYGSERRTVRLNLRVLTVWLYRNPLLWFRKGGLCMPAPVPVSLIQKFIITLSGPLASILVACVSLYVTFHYDLHGFLKLFFIAFVPAALDLLRGLFANPTPVNLDDGSLVRNDAQNLRSTVKQMRYKKTWEQVLAAATAKQYKEAIERTAFLLQKGYTDPIVYQLHVGCLIETRAYEAALRSFEDHAKQQDHDAKDWLLFGTIHGFLNHREQSLEAFDKALALDAGYAEVLNNKGYFLGEWGEFEESLSLLDRAVTASPELGYAYNNRGHVKVMLGRLEEGFNDIKKGLELERDNAYGYRNLGIYYMKLGEPQQALEQYRKAKELDPHTQRIDEQVLDAERL